MLAFRPLTAAVRAERAMSQTAIAVCPVCSCPLRAALSVAIIVSNSFGVH